MAVGDSDEALSQSAIEEVRATHGVLADWLRNSGDKEVEGVKRYKAAFADDFIIVAPDGRAVDRTALLSNFEAAKGCFAHVTPSLEMRVENARARSIGNQLYVVTYELWRELKGKRDCRMMSVILRRSPEKPDGFVWLHAHETWRAGHEGSLMVF